MSESIVTVTVEKKYFYRMTECRAKSAQSHDCICWHNKGTGPLRPVRSVQSPSLRHFAGSRRLPLEKGLTGWADQSG